MIISISGKAGSGKDTVGSIIQYLTAQLSKGNTMSYDKWLSHQYRAASYTWQIKKYSDKLKDIVCILIGCTRKQLEDQEFKETPLGKEWESYRVSWYCPGNQFENIMFSTEEEAVKWLNQEGAETNIEQAYKDRCLFKVELTPRMILQLIGTEGGRDLIHPDIWVNALYSEYKGETLIKKEAIYDKEKKCYVIPEGHGEHSGKLIDTSLFVYRSNTPVLPNWIITDSRFPNDVKRTREIGGILIRVNRAECEGRENEHASETALDNFNEWDHVIENNGTIEELIEQVRTILEEEKIIKKKE